MDPSPEAPPRRHRNVYLPDHQWRALKVRAAQDGSTISDVLFEIIQEALDSGTLAIVGRVA